MSYLQNKKDLKWWAISLYGLNIVDMMATIIFVIGYGAKELNPFMDLLLQKDPLLFVFFKVLFIGLLILILVKANVPVIRKKVALILLTLLYLAVGIWHVAHAILYTIF